MSEVDTDMEAAGVTGFLNTDQLFQPAFAVAYFLAVWRLHVISVPNTQFGSYKRNVNGFLYLRPSYSKSDEHFRKQFWIHTEQLPTNWFLELCQALPVTFFREVYSVSREDSTFCTGRERTPVEARGPSCSSPRQGCPGSTQLLAYSQLPMIILCLP